MGLSNSAPVVKVRRFKSGVPESVEIEGVELKYVRSVAAISEAGEGPTVQLTIFAKVEYEDLDD